MAPSVSNTKEKRNYIEGTSYSSWISYISPDHGVGSTDHLSRQTMRIKTVMNHNQENDQKNRPHDLMYIKVNNIGTSLYRNK